MKRKKKKAIDARGRKPNGEPHQYTHIKIQAKIRNAGEPQTSRKGEQARDTIKPPDLETSPSLPSERRE